MPTPGSTDPIKYFVNNFGSGDAEEVVVSIEAFGTNDGADYTQIAPDVAGFPGTFAQTDLSFGTIEPLDSVPFWVKVVQPSALTADNNPRRSNIAVDYLVI